MVDYWTQETMIPLSVMIQSFLKNILMNSTFNQDAGAERVRLITINNNRSRGIHSLDLSRSTDRLPVLLQTKILEIIFGSERLAISWSSIMTDRSFWTEGDIAVKYAVGQPMRIRTSFDMLALTHHVIVKSAALLLGLKDDHYVMGQ